LATLDRAPWRPGSPGPLTTIDSATPPATWRAAATDPAPRATGRTAEIVVEARELRKTYRTTVAVASVSFAVERGEVFGILGPNGAGKSTTLEMLEGLRVPDGGSAWIEGIDVQSDRAAVQARIGVQLQSTTLFTELAVADNLSMLASLYQHARSVEEVLTEVGLLDRANSRLGTLSGGQQQRVSLAAALINDPTVLFLDEPTTGLDPQARRSLWALVRDLSASGMTIVLTTHQMEEAEALCSRVAIIDQGRIVAIDTPTGLIARHGGGYTIAGAAAGPLAGPDLEALPCVESVVGPEGPDGAFTLRTSAVEQTMLALLQFAERAGAPLTDLRVHRPGLEDVFLALTGHGLRD
jgi:ABC-2 type transport system ATP-binding protein